MQNNSQEHRDNLTPKARPNCRGLRTKGYPVDDAAPSGVIKDFVPGMVTNCLKLNVRKAPSADAEILTIIDAFSNVMVDISTSSDAFYKVCTGTGVEGYCMKEYISLSSKK